VSRMTLNQQLYESTMEVLEALGEETMRAILWQMGTKGVRFTSDSFDINIFATQLQDLFGDGAESLLEEIYQHIVCRMELIDSDSSFEGLGMDEKKINQRSSNALQKIRTVFDRQRGIRSKDSEQARDGGNNS
jgi:hypothetical protein